MAAEVQEIYEAEPEDASSTPIVLIHDGGGTVFQYYMLGYLARQTYAIASPYFETGTKPDGGLPELAQQYAQAVQQTLRKGPVILGGVASHVSYESQAYIVTGWSFGGIISVQVARLIEESNSDLKVVGILMIDAYCPWAEGAWKDSKSTPTFRDTTSEKMKRLITQSFANAREMIRSWEKPTGYRPPPTAIIRAEESRFKQDDPDLLSADDGQLGWSALESLPVLKVIDVPGNHWTMFADDRISDLTDKIKTACFLFRS